MEYPKIETLYDREQSTFKLVTSRLRRSEFGSCIKWMIHEKIDGTNVRLIYSNDELRFRGRREKSVLPPKLNAFLLNKFKLKDFKRLFGDRRVVLFGEGYGGYIQKIGRKYNKKISFRLIDVMIDGKWQEWFDVVNIANKLVVKTVPFICYINYLPKESLVVSKIIPYSYVSMEEEGCQVPPEGIVARTDPISYMTDGRKVMWKLKHNDFS